jgi:hypothetical protein
VQNVQQVDAPSAAVTRIQSLIRGHKQKSKYASILYNALLMKESQHKAPASEVAADAQFRRWVQLAQLAPGRRPHPITAQA